MTAGIRRLAITREYIPPLVRQPTPMTEQEKKLRENFQAGLQQQRQQLQQQQQQQPQQQEDRAQEDPAQEDPAQEDPAQALRETMDTLSD